MSTGIINELKALNEWAKASNHHVIAIAIDVTNNTEGGYSSSQSSLVKGNGPFIVNGLVEIMKENKEVAAIIRVAAKRYVVGKLADHLSMNLDDDAEEGEDDE